MFVVVVVILKRLCVAVTSMAWCAIARRQWCCVSKWASGEGGQKPGAWQKQQTPEIGRCSRGRQTFSCEHLQTCGKKYIIYVIWIYVICICNNATKVAEEWTDMRDRIDDGKQDEKKNCDAQHRTLKKQQSKPMSMLPQATLYMDMVHIHMCVRVIWILSSSFGWIECVCVALAWPHDQWKNSSNEWTEIYCLSVRRKKYSRLTSLVYSASSFAYASRKSSLISLAIISHDSVDTRHSFAISAPKNRSSDQSIWTFFWIWYYRHSNILKKHNDENKNLFFMIESVTLRCNLNALLFVNRPTPFPIYNNSS